MNHIRGATAIAARTPKWVSVIATVSAFGFAGSAHAAGTPAGTSITNTATATFDLPGGSENSVESNTVSLIVDELLDVTVVWADPGDVAASPSATNQVVKYTVTNGGNGDEAFRLTAVDTSGGDDFDPSATSIVLDSNGNGVYDPGIDTVYAAGSNDPMLAPDASRTVFVLSTIPAGATNGQRGRIDLQAAATTGTGSPGQSFPGAGQGGGNAVVGTTGAAGEDDGYYIISASTLSFVKSASVTDPFGGDTRVPGSIITYTLVASVNGSGDLANLRVTDPIPTGTTYRPGSITLDGSGLTDATDGDAGHFTGADVHVALGTVPAGASHTITFQVDIDGE